MSRDRIVTYPAEMVTEVVDRLDELGVYFEDVEDAALNIVLDVTLAVDKLREWEAGDA